MKRQHTLALLFLLVTTGTPAIAQTDYGITVGGVKVTTDNEDNITGANIKSGHASYADGTLTLENVVIECADTDEATAGPALSNDGKPGLTIKLVGSNSLKSSNATCLLFNENTTLDGDGLTIGGENGIAIGYGTRLTINGLDCHIDCTGTGIRATADNGGSTTLLLNGTKLNIENTSTAIGPITNCQLANCEAMAPAYACFRREMKGFATTGQDQLAATLSVEPYPETGVYNYPISVCGKWITSFNASTFAVDGLKRGTVTYDSRKGTLLLDNVVMESSAQYGILSLSSSINIVFSGDNTFDIMGGPGILLMGNATIQREGGKGTVSLKARGSNNSAIKLMSGIVTFDGQGEDNDGTILLDADFGVSCFMVDIEGAVTPTLKFVNSPDVTIRANAAAIEGNKSILTFDSSCGLASQHSPYAYQDDTQAYVDRRTGKPVLNMDIRPATSYGLRIYDFNVHSQNASDILGDGTLSYSPDSQTLTMDGANADWKQLGTTNFIEYSSTKPLTIFLKGQNSISWGDLLLDSDALLTASSHKSGHLTLQNSTATTRSLNVRSCSLAIPDGQDEGGAVLKGSSSAVLTFSGSVDANIHSQCISSYKSLSLADDSFVLSPKGAVYSTSLASFAIDGKPYDGLVRITGSWKRADVNGDDRLSVADIITVANHLAGDKKHKAEEVDTNGDGRASVSDIVAIANRIAQDE